MIKHFKKIRFRISIWWAVSMAILFFLNGYNSFCIIVFSALCHELSHLACMLLTGASPLEITFGFLNFNIKYNKNVTSYKTDLLISVSGILANSILCILAYCTKNLELFYVNLSLAFVNILPLDGLDGGNIARCILESRQLSESDLSTESIRLGLKKRGKVISFAFLGIISILSGFNLSIVFSGVSFFVCGELG